MKKALGAMQIVNMMQPREIGVLQVEVSRMAKVARVKKEGEKVACRQSQSALQESNRMYKNVVELAPDGIVTADPKGIITSVNASFTDITGFSGKETVGRHFPELGIIHKEEVPKYVKMFESALRGETRGHAELVVERKNGSSGWVEISYAISRVHGKPKNILAILRDVTERKRMEQALMESEEKYRKQFEQALDGIFICEADTGMIVDCNDAACKLVGRNKSELVGKHQRILHPKSEIKGRFSRTFRQHLKEKEGQVLETQIITKRGEIREVAIKANVFKLRGRKLIQGIFRDITERKRAEERLSDAEQRYRTIFEWANVGILAADVKTRKFVSANAKICKITGYSLEELLKLRVNDIHPRKDLPYVIGQFKKLALGKLSLSSDQPVLRKDNAVVYCDINSRLLNIAGKELMVGFFTDVSERRKTEESLKESEEKYKTIFEGAMDGILVADAKTKKFVFANPQVCKITGYSSEELLKLGVNDIHPEKDLPNVIDTFTQQLQGKIVLAKDIPVLRKDKKIIYCDVNSKLIKIRGQELVLGIFRDITERKQVQESSQKLNQDLKSKVEELERFNRLTMGRELKMIELKRRIKELEERLGRK